MNDVSEAFHTRVELPHVASHPGNPRVTGECGKSPEKPLRVPGNGSYSQSQAQHVVRSAQAVQYPNSEPAGGAGDQQRRRGKFLEQRSIARDEALEFIRVQTRT
jgi:hypothetical protein